MEFLTKIVQFSLQNRLLVIILTVLLVFGGFYSLNHLKVDAVPDITNVQVQVITTSPSLSTLEIEQYITLPVERAITGIPNLIEVRSVSRYGFSLVTAVFTDGTDLWKSRQLVSERLTEASENIPAIFGKPVIGPITTGLGEVFQFTLESEFHTQMELTTYLNWYINPALKTVPGIVEVNSFGGKTKQYQVIVDPFKAASLGVSLNQIVTAVESNNISTGSGYIERSGEQLIVGSDGLLKEITDFEKIQVGKMGDGFPIYLSNIGKIVEGARLRKGAATATGKSEVVGAVTLMLLGENSLEVTTAVKEKITQIEKTLPTGMKIKPYYDRSIMVKNTLNTIVWNLSEGAILVIIILFLMIGDFRSGLVIASVIPLAMLFAISLMFLRDLPANLMSMGAIDFGLIVDGAVILIENSHRRLGLKRKELKRDLTDKEQKETILSATIEVRKATIYGEIIIGIVYIPILTLSGTEGKMFIPMATTVLFALLGAFFLTLTLIPVLASYFLKGGHIAEGETKFFQKIHEWYTPKLEYCLKESKKVTYSSIGILLLSIILFFRLGGEFLPKLDEGNLLIEISRYPSTTLTESLESSMKIERAILKEIPEITEVVSRTGSPELAIEPMGVEKTDMYMDMKPRSEWKLNKEELELKLQEIIERVAPQVAYGLSQPIEMRNNEIMAGIRADVGIKIFGDDLTKLKSLAEEISKKIKNIPGVVDLRIEQLYGLEYLRIKPNREKLARYDQSIIDIGRVTGSISSGVPAGIVYEGMKRFDIVVKTDVGGNPEQIKNIPVKVGKNSFAPLHELSEIYIEDGPVQIYHQNQNRYALVQFNIRGSDMVSTVKLVQSVLEKEINFPSGYHYTTGGEFEKFESATKTLYIVVPITLLVIFLILYFAFNELSAAIIIFLNVPFAITGGIFALYIRNLPFSISAGVGFIALFGIAVLNGLVLISFIRSLEQEGKGKEEAVKEAALSRLRPVLTTAFLASIGFIPMAISSSPGAEVQRPLATVVIGGLVSASALTLFVLPLVYLKFDVKKSFILSKDA
ncbi:efflux RND transporter permease subunit [Leptospira kanakyensis]|uniref:Efflux RND transporter permease subunit n=1 Tax=Leptospira kanakyensis TaxID=2484968 RepID=A0A6N4QDA9_9LEPT|nr:CusA/CzcA family heavy metal efflux RND transporter [Leptospira kanakyensis]TGK49985.1 efflux RND transporter permease subunit [Leptospira kanakyensis]TGK58498.1 efflux RND transporter permease subunit [Leptospira kanakyensis]TGK69123.1 efflux RND transporter permease subunit [Leptospira kanakyensis]